MQTRLFSDTSVAGDTATTLTANDNELLTVLYAHVTLTTDATVANRRVILNILDDSSNEIFDTHSGAVVTASTSSQHHEFMQGIYRETSFVGNAIQVPIPKDCVIPPGYSIKIEVENGVSGDSYNYHVMCDRKEVAEGSVIVP